MFKIFYLVLQDGIFEKINKHNYEKNNFSNSNNRYFSNFMW